ncbi:MAG: hypothetical protein ACXVDN_02970 [Ktedonobacteraceae bacterium]
MARSSAYNSYLHISDIPTQVLSRPQRTWPALLTLFFLAPVIPEMLTGSTTPLMFINPISLLFETGLYGSGAILIRELVRRRGLGWRSVVLFGAAYGILEEGLVITSWFNPYWPDLGKLAYYGRVFDTSWIWAVELTIFHAIVSITIPILFTELLFPNIADRHWLKKRGVLGFTIWLAVVSLIQLLLFGFLLSRKQGYMHPPLMYLGAIVMAVGFVWLGLHARKPEHVTLQTEAHPVQGLWKLRLLGFSVTFAFFFNSWVMPNIFTFLLFPLLVFFLIVIVSWWAITHWAKVPSWSTQHHLALAIGVTSFLLLLGPLAEFVTHPAGKNTTGMTIVNLTFLLGLILLARVAATREKPITRIEAR